MNRVLSSLSIFFLSIILLSPAFVHVASGEQKTGDVVGQIALKGKGPISGGTIFFFSEASGPPPSATHYWRVPTHSFPIDKDGRFHATLPAGNYYMGASQKFSGERLGPPKDGDIFFISSDAKGGPKLHSIIEYKPLDLGRIDEAAPFSSSSLVTRGIASIKGTIVDKTGDPVEGILVFAYQSPMMFGRPLFISDRSGKDGSYLLRLAGGGKYYIGARADYGGGPPTAKESMGSYANGQPLILKTGETKKRINITLHRMGVQE